MPRQPDSERRATVTEVKGDARHFRASLHQENGRIQEFTLSTTDTPAMPAVGQDVIIWYNIQPASTDPDKIRQFGSEPTYWANRIEQAVADQPISTYAQAQEQAAKAVSENGTPKKAPTYAEEARTKDQSIEKQVCLKAAVEFWKDKPLPEGIEDSRVALTAHHYYEAVFGLSTPQPLHQHDGTLHAHDGKEEMPHDAAPAQEEPERVYNG